MTITSCRSLVARLRADEAGFSLFEMLVSVGIMLAVTAGIFSVMNPASGTFQTQPEVSDMQQRLRVGVDTLKKDLVMAGAGSYAGQQAGTLINFFAPILPFEQGVLLNDPPQTYRTDAVTLMFVPQTTSQTTISDPMPQPSAELKVNAEPGCPGADPLCGFQQGMTVLVYDDTGSFDTMTITEVQESALHLQHNQQGPLSKSYGPGTKITQINKHIYYRDPTTQQLMHYDGFQTITPVVDNVVDLRFQYWGEPTPPAIKKPGTTDLTTTYGPKPPLIAALPTGFWPAGENCTFQVVGNPGVQVTRLPALGPQNGALVLLNDPANPATSLTDGPWCPDPNNVNRFDADLLRIRKVFAVIRVQAALAGLRGADALLFRNPGTSKSANQFAPDQEIKFEVTPRNLNLGR